MGEFYGSCERSAAVSNLNSYGTFQLDDADDARAAGDDDDDDDDDADDADAPDYFRWHNNHDENVDQN